MSNKAELAALEKVFGAEVENRLPFQSKAAIYKRLRDQGLLQDMEWTFGGGAFMSVTVHGYQLTDAGRMLYCMSCEGESHEPN